MSSSHEIPQWATMERKTLASAIVLEWNDSSASVICPFPTCQKLHSHGSNRAPEGFPTRRLSHCENLQQEYQLVWPFEADSVAEELDLGFELDRDAGIWRTIGTDIEDPRTDEILEESASPAIQGHSNKEDVSDSLDCLALDKQEYAWFVHHCVCDDTEQAALCLTGLGSTKTYLQRRNYDGNTVLALACMEGHYNMVVYLVDQGSLIDSKNNSGETPLIISLENGRIEVATYLIQHGASILVRDGSGVSVHDHANMLLEILEEARIDVLMPSSSNSSDVTETKVVTNTNEDEISEYREDPNPSVAMRSWKHQEEIDGVKIIINNCVFHESIQKRIRKHKRNMARKDKAKKVRISPSGIHAMVTLCRDVYQIEMLNERKTFAYLERGEALDLIFAVSGWSAGELADIDGCVDRVLWTKRVFEFSRIVGHNLGSHSYDENGQAGSFYACHAEKQLMAFILWHYTSLQERPEQQASEAELTRYKRVSELHQCVRHGTQSQLGCKENCKSYRGPPVEKVRTVIYVTTTICADCARLRVRILEHTGIDITIKVISKY